MTRSMRLPALFTYLATMVALVVLIPQASFDAMPGTEQSRTTLGSIREMLWPTHIGPGPEALPDSASFVSGHGGSDALLQSDQFRLVGAPDGWFKFRGARGGIRPSFEERLPGGFAYFAGPGQAITLDRHTRVRFAGVYPGIDLVYYVSKSGPLQFDFLLAAGADPAQIALEIPDDAAVRLEDGAAVLRHGNASARLAAPEAWQQGQDERTPVEVAFKLDGRTLGFELGDYDRGRPLVIDPLVVTDSTYLGSGANEDVVNAISVDAQGNIYLTGVTQFTPGVTGTFPTTPGSFVYDWRPPAPCAFNCLFVLKLTPDYQVSYGAFVPFSIPTDIAVTTAGEAVVVGSTLLGADFPWTPAVFSSEPAGQAFVLKLDAAGAALVYAASFRANVANAVALRADGAAVIAGTADIPGLPTTPTSIKPLYQPNGNTINEDGFVLTVSADGTTLLAGTYLGGLENDSATGVSVDTQNRVVVGGSFRSTDFIGVPGAPVGLGDIYLARLPADLSSVIAQRTFGGAGSDVMNALVVDPQGGYVIGGTTTSTNLPVTAGVFQGTNRGDQTGWVARVDENFAPRYLTYLGGEWSDGVADLDTDPQGNAYVAGTAFSKDLPITVGAYQDVTSLGLREGYMAVINPAGNQLSYSTYLGGEKTTPRHFDALTGAWAISRAPDGRIYVGGSTAAASFPVTGSSLRSGMGGIADAFLVRFEDSTLSISTPSLLLQARANTAYSVQLSATGGRAPYTWSVAGFQLPDGLSMSSAGVISGTTSNGQTEVDEYQFTAAVRDADGRVAHKSLFIGVVYPGNWFCTGGVCSIDLQINQQLIYQMPTLRDGQPPFTYSVTGSMPPGITVTANGSLTGAATSAGTFNATVNISDSTGATGSLNLQFVVTDPNPPSSSSSSSGGGSSSGSGSGSGGGGGSFGGELLLLVWIVMLVASQRRIRKPH